MVLQFILRPPGSIWRAGDGIWRVGGGIWRKMQISDNLDFKPENYLLGFDAGTSIKVQILAQEFFLTKSPKIHFFHFLWDWGHIHYDN